MRKTRYRNSSRASRRKHDGMAASCFALVNGLFVPSALLQLPWTCLWSILSPESWTVSEILLTVEQIKTEVVSVEEGNGNNDLCLVKISPYHLAFNSLTPSLVTSEMNGTVVLSRKSHSDDTWQLFPSNCIQVLRPWCCGCVGSLQFQWFLRLSVFCDGVSGT